MQSDRNKDIQLIKEASFCRDGLRRINTPHRRAIVSLARNDGSQVEETKRRSMLGARQPILQEISMRCREQDVASMSNDLGKRLSLKSNLESINKIQGHGNGRHYDRFSNFLKNDNNTEDAHSTMFPVRRVKRTPGLNSKRTLPRLQIGYRKGVQQPTSYDSQLTTFRGNESERRKDIISRGSYVIRPGGQLTGNAKQSTISPLVLPSISYVPLGHDKNSVDSYISARTAISQPVGMNLGGLSEDTFNLADSYEQLQTYRSEKAMFYYDH